MSASRNADAMTNAQGEFRSKVAPSEPLTTKGHAPGVKVGNDAAPEFYAETYPPGTAPESRTFEPKTNSEFPSRAPGMQQPTSASDTLVGATSADVHTGYGHPGSGMTSQEMHGGKHKHEGAGLEGVGANPSDAIHEQGHDRPYETGTRGHSGNPNDVPPGENQVPVSAEQVASERR